MTSDALFLGGGLTSKMEEKAAVEYSGGIGTFNAIGLCWEKKEAVWMSVDMIS